MNAECQITNQQRHPEEAPPYFEFFGFDIMVDSNLRPWLLEVNSPPQLHVENEVDRLVKPALAKDMILRLFHNRVSQKFSDIQYAENERDDYDKDIKQDQNNRIVLMSSSK
jgi:Tubulin-tyrosine ligase family